MTQTNYPKDITEFLKSNKKNRSLLFKAISNPEKFKKTYSKFLNIINSFFSINFPEDMSLSDKLYWIEENITYQPSCKCGNKLERQFGSGLYAKFCSKQCQMTHQNNYAKAIIVNGEVFNKISDACKQLKISHFLLKQKLYSPDLSYQYYPDHEKQMKVELSEFEKLNSKLLDKDWLITKKNDRTTMHDISKELDVPIDQLRLAYCYFSIDTLHEQMDHVTKSLLLDKNWLSQEIKIKSSDKIAEENNCSPSIVLQYCASHGIDLPPRFISTPQRELANYIQSLGFDVILSDRKAMHPMEIDVFIPSLNIGFEYHGVWYHKDKPTYHRKKYDIAIKNNLRLYQIFSDDWEYKRAVVEKKIKHILGLSDEKIYARKCVVNIVHSKDVKDFYNKNHIYGAKNCSINYGLYFNNELVAAISFKSNKLERYATSKLVIGGFSKLFKHVVTDLQLKEVITFADLCWSSHESNVYIKEGFKLEKITQPNYFWVVSGKRESREKYQKHKLIKFDNYSLNKSENEIMRENGFYKIYDAGHAKFKWTIS